MYINAHMCIAHVPFHIYFTFVSYVIHYENDNFHHRYCGPLGKTTLDRIMKFNKSLQDCPLQKLAFIHFLQYDDISVLFSVLNATAFGHLFPNHDYSEVQQQFLCQECLNFIKIRTVAASKRGIRRKLPPTRDTQPRAKRFEEDPGKKENLNSPLEQAQDLLGAYKYKTAFNLLAKTSAAARSAIVEVARYIVQR